MPTTFKHPLCFRFSNQSPACIILLSMHATCPIPLILLDLMPLVMHGKDSSKCSTVLRFFQFDQAVPYFHQLFNFSVHLTTQNMCDPQLPYIHITTNTTSTTITTTIK